jgi:hypothetical protein
VFLGQFLQELFGEDNHSSRKQPDVKEFIHVWIDGSVQPIAMIVELNYSFVHRDVIRGLAPGGL